MRKAMLDPKGVLNPGLMPRTLDDLALIAPPRDALDAHRVSLWNRVADVWRQKDDFRQAVLRYAMRSDQLDGASADLWPEVVYPLIEHAHWQRTFRPRLEAIWDYVVGELLHVPVPGVRLDRMMVDRHPGGGRRAARRGPRPRSWTTPSSTTRPVPPASGVRPAPLYADWHDPPAEEAEAARAAGVRSTSAAGSPERSCRTTTTPRASRPLVPLSQADPFLFNQNILRNLWEEAMDRAGQLTRPQLVHRTIPVGPYELAVVPTGRGRIGRPGRSCRACSMGKQIEIFTPPALGKDRASRTVIAIWIYQDASMAVVHLDFQYKERLHPLGRPGRPSVQLRLSPRS